MLFLSPTALVIPTEKRCPLSVIEKPVLWQLPQLWVESRDKMGS
jgi:hypothetical protein